MGKGGNFGRGRWAAGIREPLAHEVISTEYSTQYYQKIDRASERQILVESASAAAEGPNHLALWGINESASSGKGCLRGRTGIPVFFDQVTGGRWSLFGTRAER